MSHSEKARQPGLGYIIELASSYCKSKALFAAAELGVFTVLSRTRKNSDEVASALGLEKRPVEMLLRAAASLGLLEKKEGGYSNSPAAEMFLVKTKPMYVGEAFSVLNKRSYMLWDRLIDAVRTNKPQAYGNGGDLFEEMTKDSAEMLAFFQGLHALAYWPASALAQAFDFSRYAHLIDIGAGSGAYSIAALKRHDNLRSTIFDLPQVCELAGVFIAQEGLFSRVRLCPGDFFKDDFPQGADVVLFSNVLHDWGRERVEELLFKTFDYLPSKGAVIIADMVLNDEGTEPLYAALMSLTLLLDTLGGSNYTEAEYALWLKRAGFVDIEVKPLAGASKMVTAVKP